MSMEHVAVTIVRTESIDRARITTFATTDGLGTVEVTVVTAHHPDLKRYITTVRREECDGIVLNSQPVKRFSAKTLDDLHESNGEDVVKALRMLNISLQSV